MAQLNQDFLASIAKELPSHLCLDDFIHYSTLPLRASIRVNTLKISSTDFRQLMQPKGWTLDPIPWCQDGFWISLEKDIQLGNTVEHLQGLFYIQEASSMLPPTALFSQLSGFEHLALLDMASAPGSKTTQMAALMGNQGLLVANEYSSSRVKVLHANIQRMGVSNAALTHFDARVFGEYLFERFDAILLDAPCSGEGTIRKDPNALNGWHIDEITAITETQKALINSAFQALKPGGTLVYSTCALSQLENQQVCYFLKSQYPDAVEFEPLGDLFEHADKACTQEGFLHVWPQIFDSEGFFIAKIRKTVAIDRQTPQPKKQKNFPFSKAPHSVDIELRDYFKNTFEITLPAKGQIMARDQEFWLFPDNMDLFIGFMRFQRIGIKLADALKKGFKAQHQAVQALSKPLNLYELNQAQAIEYLMGRDIPLDGSTPAKGEVIVSINGSPLGIAKHLGKRLKNNLPRDLVRDKVVDSDAK